jgi:hypothetical protein
MSDPFAEMIDEVFAEPGFAKAAIYRPGGTGDGVAVSVAIAAPDRINTIVGLSVAQASMTAEVRITEVAAFGSGDTLEFSGVVYKLSGKAQRDDHGLLWRLSLVPVSP